MKSETKEKIERLLTTGERLEVWETSQTVRIKSPLVNLGKTTVLEGKFEPELLALMNRVRADAIRKYGKEVRDANALNYDSFAFFEFREGDLEVNYEFDAYKIDINAAYWNEAKRIFLSEKTYEAGKLVDKKHRLKALGALAVKTKKIVYEKGKEIEKTYTIKDYAKGFFDSAKNICSLMYSMYNQNSNVFGFWVDCLFCYAGSKYYENKKDELVNRLIELGYECSEEKVTAKRIFEENSSCYFLETIDSEETKKYFMRRSNQYARARLEDVKMLRKAKSLHEKRENEKFLTEQQIRKINLKKIKAAHLEHLKKHQRFKPFNADAVEGLLGADGKPMSMKKKAQEPDDLPF